MFVNKNKCYKNIFEIIDIQKNDVISIVGGGGKTTTIESLSNELNSRNIGHIIMTTTNMLVPNDKVYNDIDDIRNSFSNKGIWVGNIVEKADKKKLSIPSDEVLNFILNELKCPILIEADGTKHKPIKINREYEPVILKETTKVISVLGIDVFSDTIKNVAHRYDELALFLDKSEDEFLTEDDIINIIHNHNCGLSKGVLSYMKQFVLINKCDTKELQDKAAKLIDNIKVNTIYGTYLS